MNEVLKVLESRRSCRNFDTKKMIADADLQAIIKAGTYAATGMGYKLEPLAVDVDSGMGDDDTNKDDLK